MNSKFDSKEQELICNWLKSKIGLKIINNDDFLQANIDVAWVFRDTSIQDEIICEKGVKSKIKYFIKRIIRKSIRWYIQPILERQMHFNNATFNIIKTIKENLIIEENRYCKLIEEMQKNNSERNFNKELIEEQNVKLEELNEIIKKLQAIFEKRDMEQINSNRIEELFVHIENLVTMYKSHNDIIEQLNNNNKTFNLAKKMTYSQSGEDAIVLYILMMLGLKFSEITYVDLGANDPIEINNTYAFYNQGSRGILVEANPCLKEKLQKERPGDIVLNLAIDTEDDKDISFYIMNKSSMSTMSYESAMDAIKKNDNLAIIKTEKVKTIKINTLFERYCQGKYPTILNIDIEGKDREILESINFERYRPLIIIVEMIDFGMDIMYHTKNKQILEYMDFKGYDEYSFTGINSVFIDRYALKEREII